MSDAPEETTSGVPALDEVLPTLRVLGPAGFIVVLNLHMRGYEFFHSEYPAAWQQEYESRNYGWGDPVLYWAMANTGETRWSAIRWPDVKGVMEASRQFGINYGAAFSRRGAGGETRKTVLSLARSDREFTDEEMMLVAKLMDGLVEEATSGDLTAKEIDTLRHLRDGLTYRQTADAMGIAASTVKFRLSAARRKLGASSNSNALYVALQRKLL